MKSVRTQSGFTLIEVAIACAVASVLILLVGSLFKKSTEGLEYLTSIGQAELQMRHAIDRIVEDIQQAAIDTSVPGPYPDPVTIAAGASHDTVAIQRARGADPTVNAAENIETVTYSVNAASELVRSIAWQQAGVLYSDGPRVIARHVDGLAGGQKGFAITRVVGTSLYTVSLRVAIDLNDGTHTQLKREYRTTARIRV